MLARMVDKDRWEIVNIAAPPLEIIRTKTAAPATDSSGVNPFASKALYIPDRTAIILS